METISNVAATASATASKILWGEQGTASGNETAGQEPVSGQQGKGTANEPFDQGNAETPIAASDDKQTSSSTNPTSSSTMSEATPDIPKNPVNAAAGGEVNPDLNTDKTGVVPGLPGDPPKGKDVVPSESASNPGAAPSSGGELKQKQEGGDRPLEAPEGKEEGAVKDTKDDAEEILKKRDPNDHSGEPMKMHGAPEGVPSTQAERRESKVGNPGGQEHGKEEHGTGEQWVRTSGLAADGGDFDATKPGAGREADRLMEEKGIQKTGSGASEPVSTNPEAGQKEKVPLSEKIKSKLHIGHKDK